MNGRKAEAGETKIGRRISDFDLIVQRLEYCTVFLPVFLDESNLYLVEGQSQHTDTVHVCDVGNQSDSLKEVETLR